jgi:hypothetical protein
MGYFRIADHPDIKLNPSAFTGNPFWPGTARSLPEGNMVRPKMKPAAVEGMFAAVLAVIRVPKVSAV